MGKETKGKGVDHWLDRACEFENKLVDKGDETYRSRANLCFKTAMKEEGHDIGFEKVI